MKYLIWILIYAFSVLVPLSAQELYGKASLGNSFVQVSGNFFLKSQGELYLQTALLELTGNFTGDSGSKIYLTVNPDTQGFMDISAAARGSSEIIPDISGDWDGLRTNLIKAGKNCSETSAFQMAEDFAGLGYESAGNFLFWYIEKIQPASCLPLIVQLAGHTLLVNNNSATNGGYRFVYYRWYRDGRLLKEDSHEDNGGSYYTGGEELDERAEYTVEMTDSEGKRHVSCPYRFVRSDSPIHVSVYPNPVSRNTQAYIQVGTSDVLLMENASFEIYDFMGRFIRKMNIGHQTLAPLDLPAKPGIYMLKFRAKDCQKNIKVIVE